MAGVALDTRALVERLVAFDTTSRDSNLGLIDFVANYLGDHGVKAVILHNEDRTKANLYATIGREDIGGIALSGHTDVVPVDGQDWITDPFRVTEADGRLYGRGTADMKSFIAATLAMVPAFRAAPLKTPIHLALSYDEEVGCLGVGGILQHIRAGRPKPRLVIVGEPTEMQVVNAHKGCWGVNTWVSGLEQHSSATHHGVNAVQYAADLITRLALIAEELKAPELRNDRFDPPYSTVHVGIIHGGTARNIIPKECQLSWEIRALPGADELAIMKKVEAVIEQDLLPRMRAVHPDARIVNQTISRTVGLIPEPGSAAETIGMQLAQTNQTFAVSYGTEAGLFQQDGMPTIVCGPGNIREAHKPNEWIKLSEISACDAFLGRLLDHAVKHE